MATIVALILVIADSMMKGKSLTLFSYSIEQYVWVLISATLNTFAMTFNCIAMQNDNPAFLTILGYMSLIYGYVADAYIFDEDLTLL